jgi:hypothetical protein
MISDMNGAKAHTNGSANGSHPIVEPVVEPLVLSGILDKFEYEDTTPDLGREFTNVNIVDDLLNAQNTDELIRDLAITSKLVYY